MIERELAKLPERFGLVLRPGSTLAMIRCPFHAGGNERTPSLSIAVNHPRRPNGDAKCFACGWHGSWGELTKSIGIDSNYEDDEARVSISALLSDDADTQEERAFPITSDWRGIKKEMLERAKASLRVSRFASLSLYLPVFVLGDEVGGIYAELVKTRKHSYIETPGGWKNENLYGYDLAKKMLDKGHQTLVVVEGPRDCLRLLQYGIPAVAILGTGSWNTRKQNLLLSLDPHEVCLALDSDDAGRNATKTIFKTLKKEVAVDAFLWPDGKDPGNAPMGCIRDLKSTLRRGRHAG